MAKNMEWQTMNITNTAQRYLEFIWWYMSFRNTTWSCMHQNVEESPCHFERWFPTKLLDCKFIVFINRVSSSQFALFGVSSMILRQQYYPCHRLPYLSIPNNKGANVSLVRSVEVRFRPTYNTSSSYARSRAAQTESGPYTSLFSETR
jgi:hypothetical protein